jgi:D-proline reductase (dithiol) PrdB
MGIKDKIISKFTTRFPGILRKMVQNVPPMTFEDVPWTPFMKDLKDCRVSIVTTAGVHLKTQPPFDMKDPDGDPTYRVIPSDARIEDHMITHDYYDHSDADKDINIVFPVERLSELRKQGIIGGLASFNYGFMGHIQGPHIETLLKKTALEVSALIKDEGVDAVLLTPG